MDFLGAALGISICLSSLMSLMIIDMIVHPPFNYIFPYSGEGKALSYKFSPVSRLFTVNAIKINVQFIKTKAIKEKNIVSIFLSARFQHHQSTYRST